MRRVLGLVWEEPNLSRNELAAHLGVSEPTVSRAVRELLHNGYLVEGDAVSNTGSPGKNPAALEPNASARHSLAFLFGGHVAQVALVAMDGRITQRKQVATGRLSFENALGIIEREYRAAIRTHKVLGVAVSVSGVVDTRTGTVKMSTWYKWRDVPLAQIVSDRLETACFAINDTKAALLGERWVGAGKNCSNLAYLLINRSGVGMSFYADDRLVEGEYSMVGEVSAMFDSKGVRLADLLLGRGLADLTRGFQKSEKTLGVGEDDVTLDLLVHQAEQGSQVAEQAVAELVDRLVPLIYNIMLITDPEHLILDGILGANKGLFVQPVQEQLRARDLAGLPSFADRVVTSKLREDAAIVGAAWLAVNALLNGDVPLIT